MGSPIDEPDAGARRTGLILGVLFLSQFMVVLDITIVNVALPSIQHDLQLSTSTLQYVVTAYSAVLGGFLLLGGRGADLFGRRRVLVTGVTVFALASLTAALAQNAGMLLTSRAAQGFGGALLTTAALSTLTTVVEEGTARNRALGIWGALSGAASAVGVVLGGVLSEGPGWRWIFWINVPVGLLAGSTALRWLPEGRAERSPRLDTPGAVSLTSGLLLTIVGISRGNIVGWISWATAGTLGAGIGLLTLFVVIELHTRDPLIRFAILRRPTLRTANIVALFVNGAMGGLFFIVPLLMQEILDYSPIQTGFAYVPLALASLAGSQIAARLMGRIGARKVLSLGLTTSFVGFLLVARVPRHGSYLVDLLGPFVLLGLALGLLVVAVQVLAFTGSTQTESGLAAGLINTAQEVGSSIGVAIIATVAVARTSALGTGVSAQLGGYRVGLLVGGAIMLSALLLTRFWMLRGPADATGAGISLRSRSRV